MEKEREDRKQLVHSEIHFRGYWVQLQSRIRKNDDADDFLEGYLINPLVKLRKAWDEHHSNPRPAGDDIVQLYNTGQSVSDIYNYATCIKTLYDNSEYGDPPGSFPPTLEQLKNDPMSHFKFFIQATEKGTNGGKNAQSRGDAATKAWVKTAFEDVMRCRKACKHIWDTALATFTSAKATTVIAGLPYGAGPALLDQIENQQERQTTMALFTLFDQLISLKLGAKENFASLYARAHGIRARLKNWRPPIVLPDQLIIVCLMRFLPRQFHGTRTIIMTTSGITLSSCRDMLLDAENRDAERVKRELGTANTTREDPLKEGTGLLGDGGSNGRRPDKRKKRKKKRKPPAEKSEKYKTEGPCSVHGSRCSHASSECYVLHPELKPPKESEAAVGAVAEGEEDAQPYGFMNESLGYCLMMHGDEKEDDDTIHEETASAEATCKTVPEDDASEATAGYATPVVKGKSKKIYAVAIGHQTGIFLDYAAACRAYRGFPGHKFKSFKDINKAKEYLRDNAPPMASYVDKTITRKKPKNYRWSQSGTKSSRRAARNMAAKNHINGEVLHAKRSKTTSYKDSSVKHLARTGGIKNVLGAPASEEPEVIDLSTSPMDQDADGPEVNHSSAVKESSGTNEDEVGHFKDLTVEDDAVMDYLRDRAVDSLVHVMSQDRSSKVGVRSTRNFAPGLTTTMIHPHKVSRSAVSENAKPAGEQVTFEFTMGMDTLQRLVPGAKVKLEVTRVETGDGEALAANSPERDGPYDFMIEEYDADSEDSDDDEPNAKSQDEEVNEDLSDDEESSGPPELIELTREYVPTESESDSESEDPPNLIDLPPGCTTSSESFDTSDEEPDTKKDKDSDNTAPNGCRPEVGPDANVSDDSDSEGTPGLIDLPPGYSTSSESFDTSDDDSSASLVDISNSSSDTYESDSSSEDGESDDTGDALINSRKNGGNNTALDSGATEHCSKHVSGTLKAATVGCMAGLNGAKTAVEGMARVKKVNNVMHMPGISRNLLSVGRLLDEHGGQVAFTKDEAHLVTGKKHVLVAKRHGSGLYIVCNSDFDLGRGAGEALNGTSVSTEVAKQRVIALHKAFGHASVSALQTIIKNRNFEGVTIQHLKLLPPCEACMLGKAHKAPKKRFANDKATRFAERLGVQTVVGRSGLAPLEDAAMRSLSCANFQHGLGCFPSQISRVCRHI